MQRIILLLSIFLTCIICSGINGDATRQLLVAKKEGLYSIEDDVVILNNKTFTERVYGKSNAWLIEFYNSWCGHCIKFVPTWKAIASDMKGWRRVISIGVIDCSNEDNLHICREFEIDAYPSLKLFPPYFAQKQTTGIKIINSPKPPEIKDAVLDFITEPEFKIPPTWPKLLPLKSIAQIWDETTEEHKFVVLVFEDDQSIVGREVILDLVDYPSILVRTMLKADVEKFGIISYPSLYIINKDSSFQHLASGTKMVDSDRHRFVDTLLQLLGHIDHNGNRVRISPQYHESNAAGAVMHFGLAENDTNPHTGDSKVLSARVYMQDLESALHYSFRQEIAICKMIDGDKLDALKNFVTALAKFFPGRTQVKNLLWKLVGRLGDLNEPLTGEMWVEAIDKLQNENTYLPDLVKWVGCQGSRPQYRGYPCGMWTLFHILSVAAYESNAAVNALEVPLAIRGYMKYFFGCQECSKNFQKMANTMETEIHKPIDAVAWLWSGHNRANSRLHNDVSEDPQHPKIQFPSIKDCPQCHLEDSSGPEADPDQTPEFNSSAVMLFLIRFYGKDSIVQDVSVTYGVDNEVPKSVIKSTERKEMDWWEKKQREADLKKIIDIRERKKKMRQNNTEKLLFESAHKNTLSEHDRQTLALGRISFKKIEDTKYQVLANAWTFSQFDIGVCLIFYFICAAMILFLYYHFAIQKRYRMPCYKYLPV